MRNSIILLPAILMLALLGTYASAATVSYSANVPLQTTDWNTTLDLPKFNPSLGTLNSISFSLTGNLEGTVSLENQSQSPANVGTVLNATLTLARPDMTVLVVAIPAIPRNFAATAYDGTLDYGGTSGITYPTTSASNTENSGLLTSAADKALFLGPGTISLPVNAIGFAGGSGSANLALLFSADAGADASVTYDYTTVPEPSSLLALLSGLGGLAGFAFRRKR